MFDLVGTVECNEILQQRVNLSSYFARNVTEKHLLYLFTEKPNQFHVI